MNKKTIIKNITLLASLVFVSGCALSQKKIYVISPTLHGTSATQSQASSKKKVTIFIHGTSQTTNSLRFIPFMYNFIALFSRTPNGLNHYTELPRKHRFIQIAEELYGTAPHDFPLEHFYFFGWSGKLSPKARKQGAVELYASIKTLVASKPELHNAEITIITHSHGGNVALYLAPIIKEKKDNAFKIKQLILCGCPIQDETECYTRAECFETIYNLYSVVDVLQVADPQGLSHHHKNPKETLFSRREITVRNSTKSIHQAAITFNGYPLYHVHFIAPFFYRELPFILSLLGDEQKRKMLPKTRECSYQTNLLTRKSCRYYRAQNRIIPIS